MSETTHPEPNGTLAGAAESEQSTRVSLTYWLASVPETLTVGARNARQKRPDCAGLGTGGDYPCAARGRR